MKKLLMNCIVMSACSIAIAINAIQAQETEKPNKPENLKAEVLGHKVTLNWEHPDLGDILYTTGFEGETPFDGWEIRTTNTHDEVLTWFSYPETRFLENENYKDYIHSGEKSAMVYFDPYFAGTHSRHQDEWLISPKTDQAAYLSFHYFIDPMVLNYGSDFSFPDHYVVQVSTDGGTTWGEPIWDARYDASSEYGWNSTILALADVPTDNIKVAFRAYGDIQLDMNEDTINQGLYFLWCIDDVQIHETLPEVSPEQGKAIRSLPQTKTYREYATSEVFSAERRDNPSIMSPIIRSYTITYDGELMAEGINGTTYIDQMDFKEPGFHTYGVVAQSATGSSDTAKIQVELCEYNFPAPRNLNCEVSYDEESQSYTLLTSWNSPDAEIPPLYYHVYCDEALFGWGITDSSIGMTGVTPGIYEMAVEAEYSLPYGLSELVRTMVAVEVRFGVSDLTAEVQDKDVTLSWTAPNDDEHEIAGYTLYRAGEMIAENIAETTYTDLQVTDGYYQYTVIAVYKDGKTGQPTSTMCQIGEEGFAELPYSQNFETGFCPANIRIENYEEWTPDKYGWYFDDGSRLGIEGEGFSGYYAAIDYIEAGMYPLNFTLTLPVFHLSEEADNTEIRLRFNYSYASTGEDFAQVEWSVDGENWAMLNDTLRPSSDPDVIEIKSIDWDIAQDPEVCSILYSAKKLYLRFHYEGTDFDGMSTYHFAVDQIWVGIPGVSAEPMEKAGDMVLRINKANDGLQIQSDQSIRKVEVFNLLGEKLKDFTAHGETELTLPVSYRGLVLVRVSTSAGVKVVKTGL